MSILDQALRIEADLLAGVKKTVTARLGSLPTSQCFVVNSSVLGQYNNWSPRFHDQEGSKRAFVEVINSKRFCSDLVHFVD